MAKPYLVEANLVRLLSLLTSIPQLFPKSSPWVPLVLRLGECKFEQRIFLQINHPEAVSCILANFLTDTRRSRQN